MNTYTVEIEQTYRRTLSVRADSPEQVMRMGKAFVTTKKPDNAGSAGNLVDFNMRIVSVCKNGGHDDV